MAKQKNKRPIDSVGWLFFIAMMLLLLGPVWYFLWSNKSADAQIPALFGAGVLAAAVLAGFVTWIINWFLGLRADRIQTAQKAKK